MAADDVREDNRAMSESGGIMRAQGRLEATSMYIRTLLTN